MTNVLNSRLQVLNGWLWAKKTKLNPNKTEDLLVIDSGSQFKCERLIGTLVLIYFSYSVDLPAALVTSVFLGMSQRLVMTIKALNVLGLSPFIGRCPSL